MATNEDDGQTSFILFDASVSQGDRGLTIEHEFQHALSAEIKASFLFDTRLHGDDGFPEQLAYTAVIADQLRPNAPCRRHPVARGYRRIHLLRIRRLFDVP